MIDPRRTPPLIAIPAALAPEIKPLLRISPVTVPPLSAIPFCAPLIVPIVVLATEFRIEPCATPPLIEMPESDALRMRPVLITSPPKVPPLTEIAAPLAPKTVPALTIDPAVPLISPALVMPLLTTLDWSTLMPTPSKSELLMVPDAMFNIAPPKVAF